jgi:hypothetical protein
MLRLKISHGPDRSLTAQRCFAIAATREYIIPPELSLLWRPFGPVRRDRAQQFPVMQGGVIQGLA